MSIPMDAQCWLCHLRRHVGTAQNLGGKQAADAVKDAPKNAYLLETAQNVHYAYNGNKTITFGEGDGDTPPSGGNSGSSGNNGGSVDEDGDYTKEH